MPPEIETDETSNAAATQDVAPATESPEPDSEPETEEAHDPERAKALIKKLRPFEKEAGKLAKELDEAQRKLKAYEDEKLSEAERLTNRINELEPEVEKIPALTEQLERSNKALSAHVEKLSDGLPKTVLELLADKDVVAQLEWLTAHRDEFVSKENTKGVPSTPKPNSNGIPDEEKLKLAARTWRGI